MHWGANGEGMRGKWGVNGEFFGGLFGWYVFMGYFCNGFMKFYGGKFYDNKILIL